MKHSNVGYPHSAEISAGSIRGLVALIVMTVSMVFSAPAFAQWTTGAGEISLTDTTANLRVGPANAAWSSPLMVNRATTAAADIRSTSGAVSGVFGAYGNFGGFRIGSVTNSDLFFIANNAAMMTISTNGRVGIGTTTPSYTLDVVGTANVGANLTVAGNVSVAGNIAAKYQDFAEWVPSTSQFGPGTVVVLNTARENEVTESSRPYDSAVAGVVSAQPGIVLGEGSSSKSIIATSGRVKVHVDATKHPIRIGDLLVTGERPGTAMVSLPVEVAGVKMHRPGTVLGKALQPLASGQGEILVLLSLQ